MTTTVRARLGRRIIQIHPDTGGETAGELAAACGLDRLRIDGRPVPASCPLVVSGLVEGSLLDDLEGSDDPPMPSTGEPPGPGRPAAWEALVVTGPDSGARVPLPAGRHVIGRAAHAALAVDDPRLEPHHAAIDVTDHAVPVVTHLAGTTPVAALPPTHRDAGEGPVAIGIRLGRTRVVVRATPGHDRDHEPRSGCGDEGARGARSSPWHRDHHRPVRPPAPAPAPPVEPPAAPSTDAPTMVPAGLLPAVLGASGAVVMGIVLHQPLILLFALSAVLVAVGTWAAQHVSARRKRRASDEETAMARRAFAAAIVDQAAADAAGLEVANPGIVTALDRIGSRSPRLWERRPSHDDVWRVVLGRGEVPWAPRLVASAEAAPSTGARAEADSPAMLPDVPVTTELAPGTVLGLAGPDAAALARSLIVQLAGQCGPADWELLVVADRPARWAWTDWLPHSTTLVAAAEATNATLGDGGRQRHLVIVVDAAEALAARTSPLRRLIASASPPAVIAVETSAAALPGFCTAVLTDHDHAPARWFADPTVSGLPTPLEPAGITCGRAERAAAALAHRRDPEVDGTGDALPAHVDLATLLGAAAATADDVASGWERAGLDPPPLAVLGDAADGRIEIDLDRDGPHTLIGGTTGAGKSELLRTLIVSLAVAAPPELLSFVLVDYKGGAAFDACASLPHVAGLVTDLDHRLGARALRSLDAELRRREELLRRVGAADLTQYRATTGHRDALARLVVVVDEFATLAADLPSFLSALVGIAQRGRSLGVHLVLATQRPGSAIDDDIRANTNLRIALRVQDPAEAVDVVGDRAPATFPRRAAGRAMLRLGGDERLVFQCASTGGPTPVPRPPGLRVSYVGCTPPARPTAAAATQLETLVARITAAAADHDRARAVWSPQLPPLLSAPELAAVDPGGDAPPPVGVMDDPDAQRRRPLRWDHRRGHLLVAGALGSGTTATACAVVRSLASRLSPDELHVYVLGGRPDPAAGALATTDHCGAVVDIGDSERVERLLRVLRERTRVRPSGAPDVVLVVDGLPAVRSAIDELGPDLGDVFDGLLADGPAAGVTAVITTEQAVVPLAVTARTSQRWIMRLADAAAAAMLDLPASAALPPDAPPGRLVALPERLEAQVVAPDVAAAWPARTGPAAPPIGILPPVVDTTGLWPGTELAGRTVVPVGLEAEQLRPAAIELTAGDHILVLGTSRSGRSSALVRLASGWHDAHPDAPITVLAPRRSPLTEAADDRGWEVVPELQGPPTGAPQLLVVDDADLVEHPDLPQWCSAPGVTVIAASRPDALRGRYAHWTQAVRRSRTGLVLGHPTETDGDLLGVVLPRRWPVPRAVGRGWLIADGVCRGIVQVALDPPSTEADRRAGDVSRRTARRGGSPPTA